MSVPELGALEKVDLRSAWISESMDFTPWLAKPDNLRFLGQAIGMELELESMETDVGPFRADILCRDTADGRWVLVENQLERTDHTHLGQIITYAAGLDAGTMVWISARFTDEHRAALDWLNEHTDETLAFFGLEMELWRIGDSPMAPKFNVVCQPNDWARTVKDSAEGANQESEYKLMQQAFWMAFKDYLEASDSPVRCQKPGPRHWMNHALGRSGYHLASIVSYWNSVTGKEGPEVRAVLAIDGDNSKSSFDMLYSRKDEVERMIGFPLTWHNPVDKKSCGIFDRKDIDFKDRTTWPICFDWLKTRLEAMKTVFGPLVKELP